MDTPLLSTSLPGLPPPSKGKVRELYDLGDAVLIVATDRISAFDVIMENGIPDKGRILNQMSAFWFAKLAAVCPNHILTVDDQEVSARIGANLDELKGRCTLAKKARPLPIECVARGYISGSLYKAYCQEGQDVYGLGLPDGLVDSSKFAAPIFTPATKASEGHDENISFERASDIVGAETARKVRDWTLELYSLAASHAAAAGLILADTKFEFGETDDGLIWIDEALTPDSSRYWPAQSYRAGGPQPSFDKQYLRDFLDSSGWNKNPPGPLLPEVVVTGTRDRYIQAYELVTGKSFAS